MNNRAIKIAAVLLMGLISGCSSDEDGPPTDNDITGALVTSGGTVSNYVAVDQFLNDSHLPQVAFDGTNYLVVYEDTVTATDHDIIGALVDPTGSVLRYINIDTFANDVVAPRVAFDGTNYLVVYEEIVSGNNHDIIGARVDPNPSAVGPVLGYININVTANDNRAPMLAFDGTNYLVVYEQAVTVTNHNIVGTFVSPAGTPESPFVIDSSSSDHLVPALAFDGTNYLVVYQETFTSTDHDIIGSRVSTAGAVVGGSSFVIDGSSNDDLVPAVAFDTTNYLVVYQETVADDDHDIIGARVSTAGAVLGGSPFDVNTSSEDDVAPSLAFNGANYLVAYQETSRGSDHDIIGNRVTPAGVVSGNIAIDNLGFNEVAPAVASDGSSYFVVYETVF